MRDREWDRGEGLDGEIRSQLARRWSAGRPARRDAATRRPRSTCFRPTCSRSNYLVFGVLGRSASPVRRRRRSCTPPTSMPTAGVPLFGLGSARAACWPPPRSVPRAVIGIFDPQAPARERAPRWALRLAYVLEQVAGWRKISSSTARVTHFATRAAPPLNVVDVGPQLDDPTWVVLAEPPWPAGASEPLVVVVSARRSRTRAAHPARHRRAGGLPCAAVSRWARVRAPDFATPPNVVAVGRLTAARPLARAAVAHGGHGHGDEGAGPWPAAPARARLGVMS